MRPLQADLGLEMVLRLFSRQGYPGISTIRQAGGSWRGEVQQFLALEDAYLATIEPVIAFLQGQDPMLAPHLARPGFLPEGPRFANRPDHGNSRSTSPSDQGPSSGHPLYRGSHGPAARNRGAPFLFESLCRADHAIRLVLRPDRAGLGSATSLTDDLLLDALWPHIDRTNPDVVGLTVPFPGNLFGALRIAQALKVAAAGYSHRPGRRLRQYRTSAGWRTLASSAMSTMSRSTTASGLSSVSWIIWQADRPKGLLRRTFLCTKAPS